MTIFGVPWLDLRLDDIREFLEDSGPEPLLWEAKGLKADKREIRRQVCAFANSHDGGYLIIGADDSGEVWTLDGVEFPDEPPLWIASIIGDGGVTPYPDGLDARAFPVTEGRQVAVVWTPPTPTPPCNTHGTVYERVSGRTISVREPLRLAALFERGDGARRLAYERAVAEARGAMVRGAGHPNHVDTAVQFGFGATAAGYEPDISSRLFGRSFDEGMQSIIDTMRQSDMLQPTSPPPWPETLQDARVFQVLSNHRLGNNWWIRIGWDGAIGIWWSMAIEQTIPESLVTGPVRVAWIAADEMLGLLEARGPRYVALTFAGGRFPPNSKDLPQRATDRPKLPLASRGPLPPGVSEEMLGSLEREFRRALGEMVYEPDPPDLSDDRGAG
jgi:schlafen family protein